MSNMEHKCDELRLYAENTGELYPEVRAAVKLLAQDSLFAAEAAMDAWVSVVTRAAAMYELEIGGMYFSEAIILRVAREWAGDYLKRLEFGEEGLYDLDS